ncbi:MULTISPECIES: mannose-binding lectin [Planktothricoides]|uniref:Cyanovirin-N domain-containing protein n=1 Tax=Planktothricoides raciborskii FACHB-1370 TaxID=2949576 RepID=A0ABR8EB48_9CYAN|nr:MULTISPECIES: CVNH domain-containing protein [Planktothricoides]MBD2543537.1 hypothetical protein [Planktothricoides raciborskii FACHB-1370]MBD2581228.1 hypothetical protein [Planktothricoides raciborskii FACHB-1261]
MSCNYQLTCTNITIDGNVLSAICNRRDGSPNYTSLVLKGIENIDGTLTVTDPEAEANFHLSSQNISIEDDVLSAECETMSGDWVFSQITLNGIENIDGELTYTGSP